MEALLEPSEQFPTNISSAVLCQSKRFYMGQKSKDHCRWLLYMYADWIRVSCCTLDNDKRKRIWIGMVGRVARKREQSTKGTIFFWRDKSDALYEKYRAMGSCVGSRPNTAMYVCSPHEKSSKRRVGDDKVSLFLVVWNRTQCHSGRIHIFCAYVMERHMHTDFHGNIIWYYGREFPTSIRKRRLGFWLSERDGADLWCSASLLRLLRENVIPADDVMYSGVCFFPRRWLRCTSRATSSILAIPMTIYRTIRIST